MAKEEEEWGLLDLSEMFDILFSINSIKKYAFLL